MDGTTEGKLFLDELSGFTTVVIGFKNSFAFNESKLTTGVVWWEVFPIGVVVTHVRFSDVCWIGAFSMSNPPVSIWK